MIKNFMLVFGAFWVILLAIGANFGANFIASSQVGFFGSILIMLATFHSYKRRVKMRLENNRDEILALLKDDDEPNLADSTLSNLASEKSEKSPAKFSLKDEKARLKKQRLNFKELNLSAAFMPYRLIAYGALILGFLALNRQGMLSVAGFLTGLSAMPLGALIFGAMSLKFNR